MRRYGNDPMRTDERSDAEHLADETRYLVEKLGGHECVTKRWPWVELLATLRALVGESYSVEECGDALLAELEPRDAVHA